MWYRGKLASVMMDLRRLADDDDDRQLLYLQFPVDVRYVRRSSSSSSSSLLSPHADSDSFYINILAWRYSTYFFLSIDAKKTFFNVFYSCHVFGPIRHSEPPHSALPFTRCRYCRVARRLRIDVHDDEDDNDNT